MSLEGTPCWSAWAAVASSRSPGTAQLQLNNSYMCRLPLLDVNFVTETMTAMLCFCPTAEPQVVSRMGMLCEHDCFGQACPANARV